MLTAVVVLPLVAAALLMALPGVPDAAVRRGWLVVTLLDGALLGAAAARVWPLPAGGLALEEQVRWIPGVGTSYHLGVDGLSLPLLVLTDVVFRACAVYALREQRRPRLLAALMLLLQTTCLGLFAAQDLILFFLFFDVSIVAMYAVIAGWGQGDRMRSALTFFLYTFLGSLVLLLGFIGLYAASAPHTFDMVELRAHPPLQGHGALGVLVVVAVGVGLAIKTPTVPFHTWLPPAHSDAPAVGSAVLAGLLLKMGTYGFVRIAMPMLPQAWRAVAAFASLGIPAFSGFVAELQVFAGSIALTPVAAVALPGILLVAALLLLAVQRMTTGPRMHPARPFGDLLSSESTPVVLLLSLSLVVGLAPRLLLSAVEPAAAAVATAVLR